MPLKTSDYRKEVTERLIGMLESGTAPWQKPWDAGIAAMNRPHNFNGRPYHGVNALMLWCTAIDKGYEDPRWLTYNQVKKLSGYVNKGEKAQLVEYWQWEKEVENPETGEKEKVPLEHPKVFRACVFNAGQCSGLPPLQRPVQKWTPHERAENIVAANGVPVSHCSDGSAYYNPGGDYICLPPRESFPTEDAYYSTLLHEVGHSTGHRARLNRGFGGSFGSEGYAKEELRAELASTFLCGELGISTAGSDEQHAAYVKSWVGALKNDYNEIFRAAADAEKICNYLYEREAEYLKLKEQGLAPETRTQPEPAVNAADETVLMRMTPEEFQKNAGVDMPSISSDVGVSKKELKNMAKNEKAALMPASDAQKGFLVSLGAKFEADITKGETSDMIKEQLEKRNAYFEKINAPASKDQINTLKENNCTYNENITIGQASKIIGQLPATVEQKDYMNRIKIEYHADITRNDAAKLIENKLRAFEERDNQPATEKQLAAMKQHGIEPAENITRAEARAQIYLSPATEKQLAYLNAKNIEYDNNKICFGRASTLIENYKKYQAVDRNQPASEKQLAVLDDRNIDYKDGITKGEAYDLIKQDMKMKEAVTDKQTELCSKLGIELPANANRGYAAEVIDFKLRQNAVVEFKLNENERPNVFNKYLELANKQYAKTGDFSKIDDKKIAAELLKQGFDKNIVRVAIIEKSPVGKDFGRADELVNAAAKMPSVIKAQSNTKEAANSR